MRNRTTGLIAAMLFIAFVTVFSYGGGCNKDDSGSSIPPPKTQKIWADGSYGSWNGDAVMGAISGYDGANVSVTDNISGFATSLQIKNGVVSQTSLSIAINNSKSATEFTNGHLRFNIRLETDAANIWYLQVTGSAGGINLSPAGLSTTQFTHVDILLSDIIADFNNVANVFHLVSYNEEDVDVPIVTLNDIKWTAD